MELTNNEKIALIPDGFKFPTVEERKTRILAKPELFSVKADGSLLDDIINYKRCPVGHELLSQKFTDAKLADDIELKRLINLKAK